MWTKKRPESSNDNFLRDFERGILRSAFVSTFWAVIQARKAEAGLTFSQLADRLRINRSAVSRWFSGTSPNWEIDTIADIANALEVDIEVVAVDRNSKRRFGPAGEARRHSSSPGTNKVPVETGKGSGVLTTPSTNVIVIRSDAA